MVACLLGAQLVAPAMAVTKAQISFDTSNLPVLLSGCAAILGAALVAVIRLVRPSASSGEPTQQQRLVPPLLLGLGGLLQVGAPSVGIWGMGTLLVGIGTGTWLLSNRLNQANSTYWAVLRGLVVGPVIGVFLVGISWRAVALIALLTAAATYVISLSNSQTTGQAMDLFPSPARASNRSLVAGGLVLCTSCAIVFPPTLFLVRNATILKEQPQPIAVMLSVGGLLGLWRGRVMAERSLARRSIRQGAWWVLIVGVGGSVVLRNNFSGPIPIVLGFLVAFGGSRMLGSSFSVFAGALATPQSKPKPKLRAIAPVFLGLALGVIPLATAGHESLFWQVRELRQTYPASRTLEELHRGILSLPTSFDVANDPRTGSLTGPIRSAATFMSKQHLALVLLFSSGIAALLALLASLGLPRQQRQPGNKTILQAKGNS